MFHFIKGNIITGANAVITGQRSRKRKASDLEPSIDSSVKVTHPDPNTNDDSSVKSSISSLDSNVDCPTMPEKRPRIDTVLLETGAKSQDEEAAPSAVDWDECTICCEGYMSAGDKWFLPCAHCFHKDCVDQWLAIQNSCPVCRAASTATTAPSAQIDPKALIAHASETVQNAILAAAKDVSQTLF